MAKITASDIVVLPGGNRNHVCLLVHAALAVGVASGVRRGSWRTVEGCQDISGSLSGPGDQPVTLPAKGRSSATPAATFGRGRWTQPPPTRTGSWHSRACTGGKTASGELLNERSSPLAVISAAASLGGILYRSSFFRSSFFPQYRVTASPAANSAASPPYSVRFARSPVWTSGP